jgi:hypothetical protein
MAAINKREHRWTQEDMDFWCSASPCGNTQLPEGISGEPFGLPDTISDAGTSRLSVDSGTKEAWQDAQASGDGGD